jgi:uncharacterized Zn finger protein
VRSGAVIDLAIGEGEVRAQVMGSNLYRVKVQVAAVGDKRWKAIGADCAGSIDSMVELLQGKFSDAVMQRLCRPGDGLFPAPKEIQFNCSCPDWASMCKHVAAVLYGVGARLDQRPELLFQLRRVDGNDLLAQAGTGVTRPGKAPAKTRVLDDSALGDVFGIEMAAVETVSAVVRTAAGRGKKAAAAPAVARASPKRRSASVADADRRKARGAATARAAVPASASSRRQGAGKRDLPQPTGATRKPRAAPAGAAVETKSKPKPKRKSRN